MNPRYELAKDQAEILFDTGVERYVPKRIRDAWETFTEPRSYRNHLSKYGVIDTVREQYQPDTRLPPEAYIDELYTSVEHRSRELQEAPENGLSRTWFAFKKQSDDATFVGVRSPGMIGGAAGSIGSAYGFVRTGDPQFMKGALAGAAITGWSYRGLRPTLSKVAWFKINIDDSYEGHPYFMAPQTDLYEQALSELERSGKETSIPVLDETEKTYLHPTGAKHELAIATSVEWDEADYDMSWQDIARILFRE